MALGCAHQEFTRLMRLWFLAAESFERKGVKRAILKQPRALRIPIPATRACLSLELREVPDGTARRARRERGVGP